MGMDSSIFFYIPLYHHHILLLHIYLTYNVKMYVNTEEVFFFLPQCLIHCFLCMPEKWSLPGGEYRRIIVKDHLKIKRPRMKMTHRVYGKPMMTIRKLLFILTALVNAQFLEAQEKHQSYYLYYIYLSL